ncbi:bifunctional 4-hydroxy-3-methylbut-2-enyl diphosphate reductase/30S ribosomal protein S1 [Ruminococcus sp.]|uniref:bifunctional 4-hydroxy-3-methylbut-2-enyl diphosphate reductase/30S ribosomal protein S1 n=1 Tax=Ruminococcus sp. TaxID=41978 RepID=UPI0025CE6855|nr:bifunctional 4-hydroxy-3-methylbut-2-enyl diphosphate reductase/30S ribosomal protein S1 [Ruminococcus sp.]MBQ8967567.1 bifunctional 4-hydroxy-3-methylbut-2-enyl diphosphate reductase/30S ribosomal protein S1 [Ruminococcus sp.]
MLSKCKIFVAKSAGFCFGVDRAIKMVYNELDNRNNIVTLGPIIHNQNVVDDLKARGVYPAELEDIKKGQTVIIRSHGVSREVMEKLDELGAEVVDATCPFVRKIHNIAASKSAEGYVVLIAGDAAHPEVKGIMGHSDGECYVFENCDDFENLVKSQNFSQKKVAILAQTTYNKNMWKNCVTLFEKYLPHAEICETICNATNIRQDEAEDMAKKADLMVIVGGKHSSNTHKLKAICEQHCKTVLVENACDLRSCGLDLTGAKFIGISAGASTPGYIIKEVQDTMSELLNNVDNNVVDEEFNLEAIDKTLKKIYPGAKVEGTVESVNDTEVIVDIGTKHTGYVSLSELTDDPTKKPSDIVSVGDTIELIVIKTSDTDGTVMLSKKRVDAVKSFQKIKDAAESGEILEGIVTNVVKGGVLVSSDGVKVFVPASQAAPRRDFDLNELLKQSVKFKILEVNDAKQRAVGSVRAVARDEKAAAQAKFFETAEAGAEMEGVVKSITDYGVFVDLGGVDGLVRRADLSWNRIKHPSDVVAIGDKVTVKIKDIDPETKKVSLTYKKDSENPWEIFVNNYEVGQDVKATIVSITSFGAFAQIIDGIDGLIHISQIANQRVNNVADILAVGDVVDCRITEIDADKKRISLSRRALLDDEEEIENDAE